MKRFFTLMAGTAVIAAMAACGTDASADQTSGQDTSQTSSAAVSEGEPVDLTVFAAASMTETMEEITDLYAQVAPNVTIIYTFDSSGTLATQIEEGADCDLFISAAPKQMNQIDINGGEDNTDGLDFVLEDMRPLGQQTILEHFPNIYHHCLEEGYDVLKEPIPVVPAQHYFMGGIKTDLSGRTSMKRLYAAFVYLPLNVEQMREAASYLIGEHDFRSFASAGNQSEETIRTIYQLDVEREGREVVITVRGNGFLYNMVRIIAGTLIQAGLGTFPPAHVGEILAARDRQAASQTAPARGLTLVGIEYEKDLADCLIVREQEWRYGIWQKEIDSAGEAYLYVDYCEDRDWERNLVRLVKKSMRDGARRVWVCDCENRIQEGNAGVWPVRRPPEGWTLPGLPEEFWNAFPDGFQPPGSAWYYVSEESA